VITQKKRARSCDNSKERASKLWASKLRLPDTSDVRKENVVAAQQGQRALPLLTPKVVSL
jgi:hypothetical protein